MLAPVSVKEVSRFLPYWFQICAKTFSNNKDVPRAIGKYAYYSTGRWVHIVSLQPGLLLVHAPLAMDLIFSLISLPRRRPSPAAICPLQLLDDIQHLEKIPALLLSHKSLACGTHLGGAHVCNSASSSVRSSKTTMVARETCDFFFLLNAVTDSCAH